MQDQVARTLKAAVADAMAEKEATFERLGAVSYTHLTLPTKA